MQVSIPYRYYKSYCYLVLFLLIPLVSIPYRYYKSSSRTEAVLMFYWFQFLIGIINPNGNSKGY